MIRRITDDNAEKQVRMDHLRLICLIRWVSVLSCGRKAHSRKKVATYVRPRCRYWSIVGRLVIHELMRELLQVAVKSKQLTDLSMISTCSVYTVKSWR